MSARLLLLYPLLLLLYSVYSFSQTAPNLVLTSHPIYWEFQQHMWQLGYHMRPVSSWLYAGLIVGLFTVYGLIVYWSRMRRVTLRQLMLIFGMNVIVLLPSYPALSHDIYNYLMSAKMIHVYGASPYDYAAWDFPDDPWLSFMVNVDTTSPYGYVWTAISYVIYRIALGDLQFGMLGFRLLGVLGVIVCSWSIWIISKRNLTALALFCLNPLVILESINNAHNDITMMALFMVGLTGYALLYERNRLWAMAGLGLFWALSVLTKLVTVISPGIYVLCLLLKRVCRRYSLEYFDVLALALVAIMIADGSKRFFSWYLLWSLPIAVLAKHPTVRFFVIGLSFGGLLSYLPYLYTGDYTDNSHLVRYGLFFVPGFVAAGVGAVSVRMKRNTYAHT